MKRSFSLFLFVSNNHVGFKLVPREHKVTTLKKITSYVQFEIFVSKV